MIEPGEYFHKDTLRAVTARLRVSGESVMFQSIGEHLSGSLYLDNFLKDYAHNEPVTVDLLERLGWDVYGLGHDARYGATQSISATGMPGDDSAGIYLDWSAEEFLIQSTQHFKKLPQPRTLRDLLNALRVLGVETPR